MVLTLPSLNILAVSHPIGDELPQHPSPGLEARWRLLPKVVDLMGWNIYLYHAQFFINPAQDSEPPQPEAQKTLGFHQ